MLARLWTWVLDFIGSRIVIAVFASLFIAFTAHAISSPNRLPPIPFDRVAITVAQPFLTPAAPDPCSAFDSQYLADCREAALSAQEAAAPLVQERVAAAEAQLTADIAADPDLGRSINAGFAAASFAAMILALFLYARRLAGGRTDDSAGMSAPV